MNQEQREANILLCGSARVGKSSLINAICQQRLAKSSASLDTCTRHLSKYQMEYRENDHLHRITFWDVPGIESWNETDVRDHMMKLIVATKPLCLIYCASPGSFTKLEHIEWLASECAIQNIFCALVCTNMWAGRTRQVILNEFRNILQKVHQNVQPIEADKIIYFGRFALCTMVNSEAYIDDGIGIRKDPSGINELILGIAKSLDQENRFAWFRVVAQNQSFWSQMSFQLNDVISMPVEEVKSLRKYSYRILKLFLALGNDKK
jgi:predicted GTPase